MITIFKFGKYLLQNIYLVEFTNSEHNIKL